MPSPPRITVQLVHIHGPLKGEIQAFTDPVITIGRDPGCAVRFPADLVSISRVHARILREGNRFRLVDESTNGTFVSGKPVTETLLKTGDVITLSEETGPKFSFLAEAAADPPGEPPGPPSPPPPDPPPPSAEEAARPSPSEAPVEAETDDEPAAAKPPREIPATKAPLAVQYGPTLRAFKELPKVIGRHPDCDCVISHDALRDRHAMVFFFQDRYWIKDLTGQDAVRVNNRAAGAGVPLFPHDRIDLSAGGPFFQFMAGGRLLERAPPADAPDGGDGPGEPDGGHSEDGKKKGSLFGKWRRR
jgi:pSer/pThr/pTyr-binding forkhead associated (FHA) protein